MIASSDAGRFDPHFGLAVANNRLGRLDETLQHAQRAVDLAATDDQRINAHYQLGLAAFGVSSPKGAAITGLAEPSMKQWKRARRLSGPLRLMKD